MRNHKIVHVCGHSEDHLLEGGRAEQDRQVEMLACRACHACRREANIRRRQIAADWAMAQGLPELVGAPKQVAMAELVRHETLTSCALRQIGDNAATILRGSANERARLPKPVRLVLSTPQSAAAMREVAEFTEALIDQLRSETSAAWWEARRHGGALAEVQNKVQGKMIALQGRLNGAA